MNETDIMKRVQKRASELGFRLFRNNVGRIRTKEGAWIQYGLCVGSSDIIGWKTRIITPEMIGQPIAVFTAIEVKSATGSLTDQQRAFLATVKDAGGIAFEIRSESDLKI